MRVLNASSLDKRLLWKEWHRNRLKADETEYQRPDKIRSDSLGRSLASYTNVKTGNGEAVPVELAVFIKDKLINFNPEPSTSADIVIKDEVVVSCVDDTKSSADVPSSTEPTSHVNLSVACLGSGQQPHSG
ncbi:hypothetical protein CDAR_16321 [Caerostris darwini]|uniref:Uncharacterized protein n=1 Tax=Caerostris darwini TaxID=1538125 RepID=A0AAV4WQE1_9ARAC|nr:hypothetical protein CDAR_16321 [Caerostris darwini]